MSGRKRGRRSDLVEESDEDDELLLPQQPVSSAGFIQEAGAAASGAGSGSDDEAAAAGRSLQAVNQADQDRSTAGMIERIDLVNFLVHSKFSIDLHKHCNFIVGRNGSGKSSIMGAIMVAFGAPAGKVRSKAKTYKEFIKRGTRTAQITVTISNEGDDAFYPKAYGDKIIVTRKLHDTGHVDLQVTGVKKLPEGGVYRAPKAKEELRSLLASLSIPIDTPAVSMTQDDMKTKLASSNPAKLYQMFLEVTGLKQSWESIVTTVTEIKSTQTAFKACEDELAQRKSAMDETKKLCEGIEQFSALEGKIDHAARVLDVAKIVQSHEQEISQAAANAEAEKAKKQKLEEQLTKAFDDVSKFSAEYTALQQQASEQAATFADNSLILGQLANKCGELKQRIMAVDANLKQRQSELAQAQETVKAAQEKMLSLEEKMRASTDHDEQMQQYEAQLQAKTEARDEAFRAMHAAGTEEAVAVDAARESAAALQALRNNTTEAKAKISSKEGVLQALHDGVSDAGAGAGGRSRGAAMQVAAAASSDPRLTAFPKEIVQCYNAIQNNRDKFNVVPVGPLGMEVSLDDSHKSWSAAVEGILGSIAMTFLVNDKADASVLAAILPGKAVSYTLYPASSIDFSKAVDHRSIAAITKIDNEWARAFIYDNTKILQALMFDNNSTAHEFTKQRKNPPELPVVITRQASYNYKRGVFSNLFTGVRGFIHISLASRIEAVEAELAGMRSAYAKEMEQQMVLDQEAKAAQVTKRRLQKTVESAKKKHEQLAKEVESFINFEKPRPPAVLRELQEELDEQTARLAGRRSTLQSSQGAVDQLLRKKAELEAQLQEADAEHDDVSRACDAIKKGAIDEKIAKKNEKVQDTVKKAERIGEKINAASANYDAAQSDYAQARAALDEELVEYKASVQWNSDQLEAVKYTTEPEAKNALEKLTLQRDDLKQKMEQDGVDIQTLHEELASKAADYKKVYDKFHKLSETLKDLRAHTTVSRAKWNEIRQRGTAKMATSFTAYMRRKGHLGTIQFRAIDESGDPTLGDMVVQVAPDAHSRLDTNVSELTQAVDFSQAGRPVQRSSYADLGSLSGGEKSFAMVSLLSALWDAVDVPFAMLDEFDVFMDEATRRSAMVALLRNAREFRGRRQFIFITPHDISSAVQGSDDFVQVFRLKAVEPLEFE